MRLPFPIGWSSTFSPDPRPSGAGNWRPTQAPTGESGASYTCLCGSLTRRRRFRPVQYDAPAVDGGGRSARADPGLFRADPFIQARDTLKGRDVNVLGLTLGGAGWPRVRSGRLPLASGEVVIDSTLRYRLGDTVALGSWTAQVVGTSSETTYYFGMPTVFGVISDVQRGFLAGQPYATAIAVRGEPVAIPPGRASLRRARRSLTSTGRRGRALALAPDLLSPTSRLHTWTQHR